MKNEIMKNVRVQYTTNYSKFKKIHTNRDLKPGILNKIEKSMVENGLMLDPIKVNEDWEVVDGQHRLHV